MSTRNTSISGPNNTVATRTARTVRDCPVCQRDISLYADGTFYRHGPRGAECLGSHQEARDEVFVTSAGNPSETEDLSTADDVTRTEMNTYTVYLTAAQGGRNKHAFRGIQATTPQDAIVAAYRSRHGDHVTVTARDVHARGNDITDRHFTIYGTVGAVTFADVETASS